MKSKREIIHNDLVSEVVKLIKLFNPDPKMIKT